MKVSRVSCHCSQRGAERQFTDCFGSVSKDRIMAKEEPRPLMRSLHLAALEPIAVTGLASAGFLSKQSQHRNVWNRPLKGHLASFLNLTPTPSPFSGTKITPADSSTAMTARKLFERGIGRRSASIRLTVGAEILDRFASST